MDQLTSSQHRYKEWLDTQGDNPSPEPMNPCMDK